MATKQEIADEQAMHDRLIDALLDPLTNGSIPTPDLAKWNFRAVCMRDIDAHLDRIIGASDEKPMLARFILCLTIWKALNRLLEPTQAAPKPKAVGAVAALVKSQTAKPEKRRTTKRVSRSARRYRAMISAMSPEELEVFRIKERERQKAIRARKSGAL
jgi:hypothetical protein